MASHHESTLLRPRDPSLLNSDYWPEFELKNVHVFAPGDVNALPASLLHVGTYRPLTVTGKLEPPTRKNAQSWLGNHVHRSVSIEVTNVTEFSYGQYPDGTLDIWAAGQAGWFTIRPGRAYRETYNDIVEAVKMLYYMADTYRSTRRYSDLAPADFFQKLCEDQSNTCDSATSAEALFAKHRHFLIASMLTGKEGLQWSRVPLFSYVEETYPNDLQTVRQRIGMKPPKSSSRKGSTQSPAPSTASSRKQRAAERAAAKERSATPRTTLPKRTTRSTRSNSAVTLDPVVMPPPQVKQHQKVISTPRQGGKNVTREIHSSSEEEDDVRGNDGKATKGRSVLRPRPSIYIPIQDDDHDATPGPKSNKQIIHKQPEDLDEASVASSEHEQDESVNTGAEDPDMGLDEIDDLPSSLPFRLRESAENGDMWQCPIDGCMHKVYAASEPSSQLLVNAHQQMHEFDHDERIQLVRRMEAPWLPVNRLMERVRGMAAHKDYPPPVVQKY